MDKYQYRELTAAGEIRLVSLSGKDSNGGIVRCSIHHACIPLDDILILPELPGQGEYEAVSWTWGEGTSCETVYVEDDGTWKTVSVRPSLIVMLRHFRELPSSSMLWIDAICIDQQNESERSSQVAIMAEIFHYANNVRVWLGPHDPLTNSKLALALIRNDWSLLQYSNEFQRWQALLLLMSRRWFSRRWVVQEILHAKRATIHCGNDSVDWNSFAFMVEYFTGNKRQFEKLRPPGTVAAHDGGHMLLGDATATGAGRLISILLRTFRIRTGYGRLHFPSLSELLTEMAVFEAERSHDLIYAVLSLAREQQSNVIVACTYSHADDPHQDPAHRTLSYVPDSDKSDSSDGADIPPRSLATDHQILPGTKWRERIFEVDYQASFLQVCQRFLGFYVRTAQAYHPFDILCRPWAPRQEDHLPSWIPNVTQLPFETDYKSYPTGEVRRRRQNHDPLVSQLGRPSWYDAWPNDEYHGLRQQNWAFSNPSDAYQEKTLHITGFELDSIDSITASSSAGEVPTEWFEFAGLEETSHSPGSTISVDTFVRIVVADRTSNGHRAPLDFSALFEDLARTSRSGLEVTRLLKSPRFSSQPYQELLMRIEAVVFARRLVRSTRLQLLGLVPKQTKRGDKICILKGCSVPVVLRPLKGARDEVYHELVGECYMHTMMDGEAILVRLNDELPFERFELR